MDSEDAVRRNITCVRSIAVRTRSLSDARRFYEELGVKVTLRGGVLDEDYLEMDLGGVTLLVRPETPFQPAQADMDLVIAVDEPDARMRAALSLVIPDDRLAGISAGNVVLSDPDGRRIRLVPIE